MQMPWEGKSLIELREEEYCRYVMSKEGGLR